MLYSSKGKGLAGSLAARLAGPTLLSYKERTMVNIEKLINQLMDFYSEYCGEKPLEYAYGFFDAVMVIQDMKRELHL